jgi:cation diffusion facilitator family transporter
MTDLQNVHTFDSVANNYNESANSRESSESSGSNNNKSTIQFHHATGENQVFTININKHNNNNNNPAHSSENESETALLLSADHSTTELTLALEKLITDESFYAKKKSAVKNYYEQQNEYVNCLKEIVNIEAGIEKEMLTSQSPEISRAIRWSLYMTFVLITLKLTAAIYSGSIAIIASAVDSALDVLSQGTLVFTSRLVNKKDPYNYPSGKSRVEPLSIVVFAVIMGMSAFFLLYESIQVLISGIQTRPEIRMDAFSITAIFCVIAIQSVGYLWLKKTANVGGIGSVSVEALAQDHMNDVCSNIIGGVPAIIAGYQPSVWFLDPMGAMILSIYIAVRWITACFEQYAVLVGKSADRQKLGQLTYIAAIHDSRIIKVDTVLAYHIGPNFQCEVHVVLPSDMPLRLAHDITESLERKIERLDWVEVAFCHADYEWAHNPEHKLRGYKYIQNQADLEQQAKKHSTKIENSSNQERKTE